MVTWDEHDKYYAALTLRLGALWHGFVGRCILIGIELNMPMEDILEYIFESVHGFTLEEIPLKTVAIRDDMKLYYEHSG